MRPSASFRAGAAFLCLLGLAPLGAAVFAAPTSDSSPAALAQPAKDESGEGKQKGAETREERSAETGGEAGATNEKNYLSWMFEALGWGYSTVFFGISLTMVALMVMNLLTARRDNVCPSQLIEGFENHLNEKRYQEAYELAKSDESFLGQVLAGGLAKLSSGYAPAIEAMQEVGEEETMKLEHRLGYLALIGTISPMIGLFGTVDGMIRSFQVIAFSSSSPKPQELAKGVATALFTTLVGLAIAIPAMAAFGILKNRVARLVLQVGIVSESLMSRFQHVCPQKK